MKPRCHTQRCIITISSKRINSNSAGLSCTHGHKAVIFQGPRCQRNALQNRVHQTGRAKTFCWTLEHPSMFPSCSTCLCSVYISYTIVVILFHVLAFLANNRQREACVFRSAVRPFVIPNPLDAISLRLTEEFRRNLQQIIDM